MVRQMNFKEELQKKTEQIEIVIRKYLPKEEGYQKTVLQAMNYSVLAGGKRLRPMLMEESFRLFHGQGDVIEPFMAALEMIHNYSLVHDDLPAMDNDDYRRGKLTNHKQFNHPTALLAGDGLLNNAYIVISNEMLYSIENQYKENFHSRAKAFNEFTKAVDRMIAGEYLDTELEGQQISHQMLQYIHENKTGELLKLSIRMGAI